MTYKTPLKKRLNNQRWALRHPNKVKELRDKWNPINSLKTLRFKGKQVYLGFNPRTGVCSKCGKSVHKGEIKRTHMHHIKYDESNPLAHTIELCVGCHNKERMK